MQQNEEKKTPKLGNGKTEVFKGKVKCRQRLNLQALKSLFYKWICSFDRPDNCALRSLPDSFKEGECSSMGQVAKTVSQWIIWLTIWKALKATTEMQYTNVLMRSNAILWYYFLWISMEQLLILLPWKYHCAGGCVHQSVHLVEFNSLKWMEPPPPHAAIAEESISQVSSWYLISAVTGILW